MKVIILLALTLALNLQGDNSKCDFLLKKAEKAIVEAEDSCLINKGIYRFLKAQTLLMKYNICIKNPSKFKKESK